MSYSDRLVVKVGGSLYDHPRLKVRLKAWLAARPEQHILIVPGGGDFAEAVRRLDTVHGLGEVAAHVIALKALLPAAFFLLDLLEVQSNLNRDQLWLARPGPAILHAEEFLTHYQARHATRVPYLWDFTTDSISACAAHDAGCELVLLKSVDIPPSMAWEDVAARGYVDAFFPTLVARHNLRVTAVNFRAMLDAFPASGVA